MDADRAHQYLKAMGITVWVPRGDTEVDKNSGVASIDREPGLPLAAAIQSVPEYLDHVAGTPVESVQNAAGELMVLVEPPRLGEGDIELLRKMLAAIQLDLASQSIHSLSAAGTITLKEVVAAARPKMVLVMAGCGGNISAIEAHRRQHHQPDWCQNGVAITHHPAEINRYAELKRPAWEDLKRVKVVLDGGR